MVELFLASALGGSPPQIGETPPPSSTLTFRQHLVLAFHAMTTTRTTFTLDESLAEKARLLGVNVSAAAREGVASAVRNALIERDRAAYRNRPEETDEFWVDAEAWSAE